LKGRRHLIIGDAHAKPGTSNDRFDWLARFVLDHKPDVIVEIGDWEDMESLSSYDMGKMAYEGRRYKRDLEAAWDARQRFIQPLREYNKIRQRNKERQYRPEFYAIGGNHFEGRIKRAVELTPMLEGTISVDDGRHREFGWKYVPYLTPLEVDGFTYQHYFTSGVMGKPVGGENPADALIKKTMTSCCQGHSHLFDIKCRTRPNGRKIWGIHAGCYFEHTEDYAGPANNMWSRGLLLLDGVHDGDIESFKWFGINEIRDTYGERAA
jgi:hypothetical protein